MRHRTWKRIIVVLVGMAAVAWLPAPTFASTYIALRSSNLHAMGDSYQVVSKRNLIPSFNFQLGIGITSKLVAEVGYSVSGWDNEVFGTLNTQMVVHDIAAGVKFNLVELWRLVPYVRGGLMVRMADLNLRLQSGEGGSFAVAPGVSAAVGVDLLLLRFPRTKRAGLGLTFEIGYELGLPLSFSSLDPDNKEEERSSEKKDIPTVSNDAGSVWFHGLRWRLGVIVRF